MNGSRAVTEMLLLFLAFFLPGYLSQALGASPGAATTLVLLQSIVTGLPQLLLIAYIAGVTGPFTSPEWGCAPLESRDALRVALLVGACFAIIAPFAALSTVLPRDWTSALRAGYRWELRNIAQLPVALVFCMTAGYREELFFRSYLFGRLEGLGVQPRAAIAGSTLVFCLGHAYEGPLGFALAAGLGVLFGAVYARRRNLHVIAVAHGLYNFIVLVLSLFFPRALPVGLGMRIFIP